MQNELNAIITINSFQRIDDEEDSMEIITEGSYYEKNGKFYIMYKDDETMGNSSSFIKVDGDSVSIRRKGEYSSQFTLKEGTSYSFVYHMPYGDMAMQADTKNVEISLGESGGELKMCYELDAGGNKQINTIKISVRMR